MVNRGISSCSSNNRALLFTLYEINLIKLEFLVNRPPLLQSMVIMVVVVVAVVVDNHRSK
jgi:hypothetical protein